MEVLEEKNSREGDASNCPEEVIGGETQDDQLISSLLTQFQYCSIQTIQAEGKCRTYAEAMSKLQAYIQKKPFARLP